MDKITKILDYAQKMGEAANHAEKVGTTAAGDVYSLGLLDDHGFALPTGLPRLVVAKGENCSLITGNDALALLGSFDLEE
ncbi:hypothetical protein [uncultured Duncaniella sp.]|uniref:hypothetical protein n=1 Tax=uncultured Duncaniella sp. TaxID=2768039 RepID=UPI0025AA17D0|nr:hypothetical protein [uncultured Duncaniella sp.]